MCSRDARDVLDIDHRTRKPTSTRGTSWSHIDLPSLAPTHLRQSNTFSREPLPEATSLRTSTTGTVISLHVLAYNLKRLISVLGFAKTMKAMTSMGT